MEDLPVDEKEEEKVDLKDALGVLIKNKRDAIDAVIYLTLKWPMTSQEIAAELARLKLLPEKKRIILARPN